MLGIRGANIIEHVEGEQQTPEDDEAGGITLVYNHTDPLVISDGIDRVTVVEAADDQYRIDYWGYRAGYLRVTRDGMAELGETLLGNQNEVPSWLLESEENDHELPWWVPDDYDGQRRLTCHHCGRDTPAGEILTPGAFDGETDDRYCPECWDNVRERWQPEDGLSEPDPEPSAVDQAAALRDKAAANPADVPVDEIAAVIQTDIPDAQEDALHALIDVIPERPDAALDLLSLLTARLESDAVLVRCAALYCLADLAEEYPHQVTPVADEIVAMLDPEADQGILEGAHPYVAAVAEAEPGAVIDAVPKLAALLQAGTPCEHDAILALTRIAKAYPEQVLPVTTELCSYIETEDSTDRVATLAALGYVAKEYPNAAASTIPTVTDLLDAESNRLRANAAALLADLADEYHEEVRPAVPTVIDLLTDEDDNARYNATSILAKVAKNQPEAVEPAVDPLIDALDDDIADARSNVCWALGYLEAARARPALKAVKRSDPDEEVRHVADWALRQLEHESNEN